MATLQPANSCFGQDLFPRPRAAVVRGMHATNNWQISAKRSFDVVVASVALMVLALPMLIIAILIRAEKRAAPSSARAVSALPTVRSRCGSSAPCDQALEPSRLTQAYERITTGSPGWAPSSRTRLDELPQLFNVLRGDMLVGGASAARAGDLRRRHAFRTGHALIRPPLRAARYYPALHRCAVGGETETDRQAAPRLASDLEYIQNWSLCSTCHHLVRTLLSVPAIRNAY